MQDFIVAMSNESQMATERARVQHFLEQTRWQPFHPEPGWWQRVAGWVGSRLRGRPAAVPTRARTAGPMGCAA